MSVDTSQVPRREIPRGAVTSSNIASIGYNAPTQQLAVEFKSGAIFHYDGVLLEVAQRFDEATSKGRFFITDIKGRYRAERMTGKCPACGDVGWVARMCADCGTKTYARLDTEHVE